MARETGINVTLRWAKDDFVNGYVSSSLCEACIELTEEQAKRLHSELCKRFGTDYSEAVPVFVPTGGGSDK